MKFKIILFLAYIAEALWVSVSINQGNYGHAAFMFMMGIAIIPHMHQRWDA